MSTPLEKEIMADIKALLERQGWMTVQLAQSRAAWKPLVGAPDLISFRSNHTLLIEVKRARGIMREKQIEWANKVSEHLGNNLHYIVARSKNDVANVILDMEIHMSKERRV